MANSNASRLPALLNPRLRALLLERDERLALGGFRNSPPLLDEWGDWEVHGGIAVLLAVIVGVASVAFVFPPSRWPLGVMVVLAVAALAFADNGNEEFAWPLGLGALIALVWSVMRLLPAEREVWMVGMAFALAAGSAAWGIARGIRRWSRRTGGLERLGRLYGAVDTYNGVVRSLDVLEQLAHVQRHSVGLSVESDVAVLVRTRRDLVRAMQAERILREHRNLLRLHGTATGETSALELTTETERLLREASVAADRLRDDLATIRYAREAVEEVAKMR